MQTITRTISADKLSKVMRLPKSMLGHSLCVTISPEKEADDQFYCESNLKALDDSYDELMQGRVVVKTFEELDAMEIEAFDREAIKRG